MKNSASLLRWYPEPWRVRYGPELFDPNMLVTTCLMLIAIAVAGYGVTRISVSWKELRTASAR
jgi:hypothetical protein